MQPIFKLEELNMSKVILVGFFVLFVYISYVKGRYNKRRLDELFKNKYAQHECICGISTENAPKNISTVREAMDSIDSKNQFKLLKSILLAKIGNKIGMYRDDLDNLINNVVPKNPEINTTVQLANDSDQPSMDVANTSIQGVIKPRKSSEDRCREVLEEIFGKRFPTVRPSFLKNPHTGKNLELDCYNDELKLAVEYNGEQHYKYTSKFHRSTEDFKYQLWKDELKAKLCLIEGVELIVVPYTVKYSDIPDYIIDRLKEIGYVSELSG
jgi:hypothetical protein